jgi:hypothetical protein
MIAVGGALGLLLITSLALGALALRPRPLEGASLPSAPLVLIEAKAVPAVNVPGPVEAVEAVDPVPPAAPVRSGPGSFTNGVSGANPGKPATNPAPREEPALPKPPPALPAALALQAAEAPAACGDGYGTSIAFLSSPRLAAQRAVQEQKLLFTLHVSGNFEDPQFT